MCIRDRHTIAALYAIPQSVDRISSQQHRKGHVLPDVGRYALPVSYTHLDVYKRQAVAQRLGITATTLEGILTVKGQGRR